ncbi:NUDIX hydrolase [Longispora sp. NPDC051575]|uniref:NUDIX hydrolase n=1 Tax=Longispora sp. NPDC051575 TaxID=3154943 RepID=UPI003447A7F8
MTDFEVLGQVEHFKGRMFDVVTDEVRMPGGGVAKRDYMRHVGAVGVVAVDEEGRVLLVRQYRHPVAKVLWELPAGLIDVPGEPLVDAAARELAEEADLVAANYALLVDLNPSPGCSDERIRLFLARGLSAVPESERHVRTDEEAGMTTHWIDLDEACAMALSGEITNGACLAGVLAAARARDLDWKPLRAV